MGTFEHDLELGRKGEEAFSRLLRSDPFHVALVDVREDDAYRARDVDFIWTTSKGRYEIEVKTERLTRPNVFLETISNVSRGTPGWYQYSTAAYVAQGFLDQGRWYIYSLPSLRRAVSPIQSSLRSVRSKTSATRGGYETEGILLPISSLQFRFALMRTIETVRVPGTTLAPLEGCVEHERHGIGTIEFIDSRHIVCRFAPGTEPIRFDLQTVLARQLLKAADGKSLALDDLRQLAQGVLNPKK